MSVPPRFCTDYAKRVSKCQKCKMQLEKGILRLGKIVPNFFIKNDDGKPPPDMKQYFHRDCLFEMLFKARPTTKVIDSVDEIEGLSELNAEDQDAISKLVDELTEKREKDSSGPPKTPKSTKKKAPEPDGPTTSPPAKKSKVAETPKKGKIDMEAMKYDEEAKYNGFYKFCKIIEKIRNAEKQGEKAEIFNNMEENASFDGHWPTWLQFLQHDNGKNSMTSEKKVISAFTEILHLEDDELSKIVKKSGNLGVGVRKAIEKKKSVEKSDWDLQKIERFIKKLADFETDAEIGKHFLYAVKRLCPLEMEVLVQLSVGRLEMGIEKETIYKKFNAKMKDMAESSGFCDKPKTVEKPAKPSAGRSKKEQSKKKSRRDDSDSDDYASASESEKSFDGSEEDSDDDDKEEMTSSESEEVSSESELEEDVDEEMMMKENVRKPVGTRTRPVKKVEEKKKEEEEEEDEKEPCYYGAKCYRKNKEHLEQYSHPNH